MWWERVSLNGDNFGRVVEQTAEVIKSCDRSTIEHDLRWMQTFAVKSTQRVEVMLLREGDRVAGYMPFLVQPSSLPYRLGELTLYAQPVRQYLGPEEPLIDATIASPHREALVLDLYRAVNSMLGPDEVVRLEAVRAESPFYKALADGGEARKIFHVVPFGRAYQRRRIVLGNDFDEYLRGLSHTTRKDLRRTHRRFTASMNGDFRVQRFRRPDEVSNFLIDAILVSQKTHQWRLLDAGLSDRDILEQRLSFTAAQGWLRSYILYAREQPVAFRIGHQYGSTYYSQIIGYDPEWAQHHVGIFLFMEVIKDLLGSPEGVTEYDFGNDDSSLKRRLSNRGWLEGYLYLIPRGGRGALMARSLLAINALSAGVGWGFERLHIKDRINRAVRTWGWAK